MSGIKPLNDYVLRATAADGAVRAFAAYTKRTVDAAREMHNLSRTATAALGRTLTAGAMMAQMMKGKNDALSIVFAGDGPLDGITVTAKTDGSVKGYVGNPQASLPSRVGEKLKVGGIVGQGTLRVIYDIAMREPYSGVVEIQSGEIADDIAFYLTSSDQIPSAVSLGVLLNDDCTVREAGGFIIQMMDNASDELAEELTKRIQELPNSTTLLVEGETPESILERILGDKELNILERTPVEFKCECSHERTKELLKLISNDELQSMIDDNEDIEMVCSYCNAKYTYTPEELKAIAEEKASQ